ncbi:polysaccharide deacetylase family protein [Glutamicibacter ardleyensis]|uniref:NodB homology domain-containing protein n=1 Tax=Glutamicibacter ardleyensis TaxID=225894 RepID=A0ABQ2DVI3_9MICC|nr:polysaccharide deacetylase family protein [Glutamicibacter ardleyensis]GGJ74338.1 hypothetical protein GCM10007173_36580 [Glutamicibacter ardleyensis]
MAWIVLANLRGPAGATAYWSGPGGLDGTVAVNNLPVGAHPVVSTAVATSLGLPRARPGTLIVHPVGSSGARDHEFISIEAETAKTRKFIQHRINGVTSSWTELANHISWDPSPLLGTDDLWALENVSRPVTNVVIARDLGLPRERPGFFTSKALGTARIHYFESIEDGAQPSLRYKRQRTLGGVIQPWEPDGGGSGGSGGSDAGPVRHELLTGALTARKGGRIGTNGKGVIALRFDDAAVEFRTTVLPLLKARNLPFTRVTTSKSVAGVNISASEFPIMQTYSIESGGEVWNHGRDHADAAGDSAIYANVIGGLEDLRTMMPRVPIDCFAPPGGPAMSYDGHLPSTAVSNWSDTYAGRLIAGHHALSSGYFADSYYRPLDGVLRDGQIHYSVDTYDTARCQELVDRARDWKKGVVMMWHSNNIGTAGNMTLANFIAVLDYIVAQRDAGNIIVLTKSGLGVADVSSSYRDDALTTHSGSSFSEVFAFPQYRQNLPGSTRELTATVTGGVGATVTSKIGESTKTHTIPSGGTLNLRHVATIPLDATALTVSINANTSNAKLLAV